jgi:hypothetical protein
MCDPVEIRLALIVAKQFVEPTFELNLEGALRCWSDIDDLALSFFG